MINRRNFLKNTTLVSAPYTTFSYLGAKGDSSPNSRINIAVIGPGKWVEPISINSFVINGLRLLALLKLLMFAPTHQRTNRKTLLQNYFDNKWNGLKITNNYLELLEDKSLDAVLIATPDHWHGEATIRSARAKKHVYCEKPISLTIQEGRNMVEAVKENNCISNRQPTTNRIRRQI